jgi:hypothetical protein
MSVKAPKKDRSQEAVKVASPERVQQARKARDHGKNRNADGSLHSTPNPHGPTSGTK